MRTTLRVPLQKGLCKAERSTDFFCTTFENNAAACCSLAGPVTRSLPLHGEIKKFRPCCAQLEKLENADGALQGGPSCRRLSFVDNELTKRAPRA